MKNQIFTGWGRIQNNKSDSIITDFFEIKDFKTLLSKLEGVNIELQNYYKRRWFLWQCSLCDEYLFYSQPFVFKNNKNKDKTFDVFFEKIQVGFDIKSTLIPKDFRNQNFTVYDLIDFYYINQSKGTRFGMQNRLFLVHLSNNNYNDELTIRTDFDYKEYKIKEFCLNIEKINFINYKNALSYCLFL